MKTFIEVFPTIFQNLMGLGKSRCDIPSDTTQGCFTPTLSYFWLFQTIPP